MNYREYYLPKSTDTLLNIYQTNRGKYEDGVYDAIEKILEERNVRFDRLTIESEEIEEQASKETVYLPMILGAASILISIFSVKFISDLSTGLIITVGIRLLFFIYAMDLIKRYKMSSGLWVTLVLVFGGFGLILLNWAILFKHSGDDDETMNEEDNLLVETVPVANTYSHCPACLKDLHGQNKCIDCDLEFE